MSAADVDIVRGIYAAFNRGDFERVANIFDEDIVWIEPQGYFVPDGRGETVGRDAVMSLLAQYPDYWDRFDVEAEEVFDAGAGNVFVLGRQVACAKGSGQAYTGGFVNLWRVRDGRAVEHRSYSDTKSLHETIAGTHATS